MSTDNESDHEGEKDKTLQFDVNAEVGEWGKLLDLPSKTASGVEVSALTLARSALAAVKKYLLEHDTPDAVHCGILGKCRTVLDMSEYDHTVPVNVLCDDFVCSLQQHMAAVENNYTALAGEDILRVVRQAERRCECIWIWGAALICREENDSFTTGSTTGEKHCHHTHPLSHCT